MRKIPLFLISILVFTAIFTPSVKAEQINDAGIVWYTVAELLDYKKEIDQEFEEICKNNASCIKDIHTEKYQTDQKYAALYAMEVRTFLVTEINHQNKTFKMIFFDERLSLKKGLGLATPKLTLKDAYIAWFDDKQAENNFTDDFRFNSANYYENRVDGVHLMLGHKGEVDGYNWFNAYNTEIEYNMADASDPINDLGTIQYKLQAVSNYSGSGIIGYSNCLKSAQYKAENGCTILISSEKGPEFFPILTSNEVEEDKNKEGNNNQYEQKDQIKEEDDINKSENKIEDKNQVNQDNNLQIEEDSHQLIGQPVSKSPNTGVNTNHCTQKTVEFPWWLVIIIALGDALVLWLFWPNGKNSPKNHKITTKKS